MSVAAADPSASKVADPSASIAAAKSAEYIAIDLEGACPGRSIFAAGLVAYDIVDGMPVTAECATLVRPIDLPVSTADYGEWSPDTYKWWSEKNGATLNYLRGVAERRERNAAAGTKITHANPNGSVTYSVENEQELFNEICLFHRRHYNARFVTDCTVYDIAVPQAVTVAKWQHPLYIDANGGMKSPDDITQMWHGIKRCLSANAKEIVEERLKTFTAQGPTHDHDPLSDALSIMWRHVALRDPVRHLLGGVPLKLSDGDY